MTTVTDEILAMLRDATPEARKEIEEAAQADTSKFLPNPGPQTDAWFSKADILLYGGQPGGGKSGLLCGLALCRHRRSLLMRREGTSLEGGGGLIEDLLRINGDRDGFSGKPPATLRTKDERIITFGSAPNIGDEQKFQGRPRDLLGLDEATQFAERQVRFLMGWVRTEIANQRTRTIFATNPPATAEGEWIVGMFRPWLDPTHDNPAEHGELRWFITVDDLDVEVEDETPVERNGRLLHPASRTFIPAALEDNPYIVADQYRRQLDTIGADMRHIVEGDFMAARKDDRWQVIPTDWIIAAEERWTPEPPEGAPMSALGVDPAQGGSDETVLAPRYDWWFDEMVVVPGAETPTGNEIAGLVVAHRKHNADVIIDMGGGYGGAAFLRLKDNGIDVIGHKGADGSKNRTADSRLRFANKRSEVIWRMREALDPAQEGGSPVALPPDRKLRADLTAPRYQVTARGIQVEAKDKVIERLGRSPDRGDAVCMAYSAGGRSLTHGKIWRDAMRKQGAPNVIRGRRKR